MTETPRPDPWKKVGTYVADICLRDGDMFDVDVSLRTEVDAARAADAAEIARLDRVGKMLGAECDRVNAKRIEQAETIRQLQAQIATLTQERDEEARAFQRAAKDRDICRQKRVDLEARCATLTAALEGLLRAPLVNACDYPECDCEYSQAAKAARAALAAAPQGDKA